MFERITAVADRFGTEYYRDFPLSKVTSFQTGGNADILLLPNSAEALSALISACRESDVPYCVVGNGSNLLVSDKGVRGAVLRLSTPLSEITYLGDGKICCAAGAPLTLCHVAGSCDTISCSCIFAQNWMRWTMRKAMTTMPRTSMFLEDHSTWGGRDVTA